MEIFASERVGRKMSAWTPTIRIYALANRVLVVAKTRFEGTWAAYCDAVPGINHKIESDAVLQDGDKLLEDVARKLFPVFEELPYAR